jgi:lipopolysaccharide transport system permease protein
MPRKNLQPDNLQPSTVVLRPSRGWTALNLRDLWLYRELVFFMTWRDLKVRYKQTLLGVSWAVLQPFLTMVVFSVIFGQIAKLPSDGIPYPIFTYTALLPWTLFANALNNASRSLVSHQNMVTKIYFPRLVLPLSSILAGIVDFALAFLVLIGMMVYYNVVPTPVTSTAQTPVTLAATPTTTPDSLSATPGQTASSTPSAEASASTEVQYYHTSLRIEWLTLPLYLLLALITALGVALWLSALYVKYRDVNYVLPFLSEVWKYISPVAYSAALIPVKWQIVYSLNPMAGVVNGFRWALLGTPTPPDVRLLISVVVALILLLSGLFYFRNMEKTFADTI